MWGNLERFSPEERDLRFVVVSDGNEAVGLFPLEMRKLKAGPVNMKCRGFISHYGAPLGTALLVDSTVPQVWRTFLDVLMRQETDWHCLSLEGIEAGSPVAEALTQGLAGRALMVSRQPWPEYLVQIEGTAEDYLKSCRKRHRRALRNGRNRLERMGRVQFTGRVGDEPFGLSEVEKLDRRTWLMNKPEDVRTNAEFLSYCKAFMSLFPERDAHLLRYLLVDGKPAAAHYSFRYNDVLYAWKNGFDEAYRAGSPASCFSIRPSWMPLMPGSNG